MDVGSNKKKFGVGISISISILLVVLIGAIVTFVLLQEKKPDVGGGDTSQSSEFKLPAGAIPAEPIPTYYYTLGDELSKISQGSSLEVSSSGQEVLKTNWSFIKSGDTAGVYKIKSRINENILAAKDDWTMVAIPDDPTNQKTQWFVYFKNQEDKNIGKVIIRNFGTGKCLTVIDGVITGGNCETSDPIIKTVLTYDRSFESTRDFNISYGTDGAVLAEVGGVLAIQPSGSPNAVWNIIPIDDNYLIKNKTTENIINLTAEGTIVIDKTNNNGKFNILNLGDGRIRFAPITMPTQCIGVINGEVVAQDCGVAYWSLVTLPAFEINPLIPEGGIPAVIVPTYHYMFGTNASALTYNGSLLMGNTSLSIGANWGGFSWFLIKVGPISGEYALRSRFDGSMLISHDNGTLGTTMDGSGNQRTHWIVYHKSQEDKDMGNITLKNKISGNCLSIADDIITLGDCSATPVIKMDTIPYKHFIGAGSYNILFYDANSPTMALADEEGTLKCLPIAGNEEKIKWIITKSGDNYTIQNEITKKYIYAKVHENRFALEDTLTSTGVNKFNISNNPEMQIQKIHPINTRAVCMGQVGGEITYDKCEAEAYWQIVSLT